MQLADNMSCSYKLCSRFTVGFVLGFLLHLAIDALVFGTALGLGCWTVSVSELR
jgi:hypothetical protein